ncbi:DUF2336 domain-containing protein [Methylorubrum suomiense]|uniref:DUF2336 domain-containing protein n=1 Tax=Methylorubrum suomiense TaxID=144191 RepID=A0ABQ4UMN6_9HYPH|nr:MULTISPECIES: DUF2336 domain-containing protein [Methylobacteriaceae]GJE73497.1 hypothetical protein BGCPKDLD_0061 [Methylorubrum suomiense]
MILRQFLTLTQHASAERRAEAAGTLARAYLDGSLGPDAAWEAKTALLALLDDPVLAVRRALAEACADSASAPRPLVVALASDHPEIACLVLARSPVLMDADLVDCVAIGCEAARSAVAARTDLSRPVAAALAEVAGLPSLVALAKNPRAAIGTAAFLRMVDRHGEDAALCQALLARHDLTIEVRHAVVARLAEQLARVGQDAGWMNSERGARVARDARDAAALALGDEAGETGLARLITHLRVQEQLTAGLILRAILSLRLPFAEAALAELSGLSRARVAGLMFEPYGAGFTALHRRAGLPILLLPAIQAALTVWREAADGRNGPTGPRLARSMIEAALTACETLPFAEARGLVALLARFEAEAARDEARLFAQEQMEAHSRDEAAPLLAVPEALAATGADGWAEMLAEAWAASETRALPEVIELSAADAASAPSRGERPSTEPAVPTAALPTSHELEAGSLALALPEAEMPDADAAWPLAPRPEERLGASVAAEAPSVALPETLLADLSEALVAHFLAERPALTAPPQAVAEEGPSVAPEVRAESRLSARPREIALAVTAGMIPQELVLSYRDDRIRERLAA